MSEPTISPELNQMLVAWHEASQLASQWAEKERDLRKQIFETCFPTPNRGTDNRKALGHDRMLVGDYKTNFKVDRPAMEAILDDKKSNVRPILLSILRWDPKVKPTEFAALKPEERNLLADVITETPGLPAIEIKTASKMRKKANF